MKITTSIPWLLLIAAIAMSACGDNDYDYEWPPPGMTVQKLVASDGVPDDHFGGSVAIAGDTVMIGAEVRNWFVGAVYVFARGPTGVWSEQQILVPSGVADSGLFGAAIALEGDMAIIGATGCALDRCEDPGSAYLCTRGADGLWTSQQQLKANDLIYAGMFGNAVDRDGDTAVIAAWFADGWVGAVYVFTRGPAGLWTEQQKLIPGDFQETEGFGRTVAISADTLMVGAQGNTLGAPSSVYIFTVDANGSWREQQKISGKGNIVSLDRDVAIIGQEGNSDAGERAGAANVFTRGLDGVWIEQQRLTASDATAGDRFGRSVALYGNTAVIGAPGDDDMADQSGAAYLFSRSAGNQWTERLKLTAEDGAELHYFGSSSALYGGTIVIGSRESGYVFQFASGM